MNWKCQLFKNINLWMLEEEIIKHSTLSINNFFTRSLSVHFICNIILCWLPLYTFKYLNKLCCEEFKC